MRTPAPLRASVTALLILAAVGAGLLGYARYLGWLGGPLTRWVPATVPPPPAERGTVALFWSGDMGFNTGMGPRIAADVAARGIPVLGINSLTAFAHRRSPAEIDALVRRTAEAALRRPGARRVVLIGQSFGANALLAGIGALPLTIRARVQAVVLVVPADTMLRRATPGGILDRDDDGPAIGAARALDWAPVLCIRGATEEDSLCPRWRQPNVSRATLPGDHYLRHDDGAVARAIAATIARTA